MTVFSSKQYIEYNSFRKKLPLIHFRSLVSNNRHRFFGFAFASFWSFSRSGSGGSGIQSRCLHTYHTQHDPYKHTRTRPYARSQQFSATGLSNKQEYTEIKHTHKNLRIGQIIFILLSGVGGKWISGGICIKSCRGFIIPPPLCMSCICFIIARCSLEGPICFIRTPPPPFFPIVPCCAVWIGLVFWIVFV